MYSVEKSKGWSWLLLVRKLPSEPVGLRGLRFEEQRGGREGGRVGAFDRGEGVVGERSWYREGWMLLQGRTDSIFSGL